MTSQETKASQSADRDIPDTEVIVLAARSPVFVDSTGRRRRLLRRLAYAFGAVCMLYGGLLCVSLAGGPVSSSAILPLPDLPDHDNPVHPRPSPTPEPTVSTPPKAQLLNDALRRRPVPFGRTEERIVVPLRPATTPAPARTTAAPTSTSATPSPTVTRTVESTSTPSPSASESGAGPKPPTTPPTVEPAQGPAPVPPGGSGGGSGSSPVPHTGSDASGSGDDALSAPAQAPPVPPDEPSTTAFEGDV